MRWIAGTVVSFIMLFQAPASSAQTELSLTSSADIESRVTQAVLKEAYKQLGISLTVTELPAERALVESNAGRSDGEVNRIEGLDAHYPNLMRVPVSVGRAEVVVFSKTAKFQVNGWDSLKPYAIGIRIGMKFVEQGSAGMNVRKTSTAESGFQDLDRGVVDVTLQLRDDGLTILHGMKLQGITMLEPPLASIRLYHYLHKKHRALVPKITEVLRKMEAKGQIEAIRKRETNRLLVEGG